MLLPNRIWVSSDTPVARDEKRPALFLDRDGVLVKEAHYLSRVEDVHLEQGAAALIGWARGQNFIVVVATNQSGIGRGFFGWEEFKSVEAEITRQLARQNTAVDLVIACPYHAESPSFDAEQARWRKPGGAMLEYAGELLAIDLGTSWMVGDKASDIEAARNAGLAGAVHVLIGHGAGDGGAREREAALQLARSGFTVLAASDLAEAQALLEASSV